MEDKKYCSSHPEIEFICYCQKCDIYLCNKCQKLHSDLFKNHIIINSNDYFKNYFTGLCKMKDHQNKLIYFCKEHNQLCCVSCIPKIKGEGNGQHSDCNICILKEIEEEKKKALNDNIIKLKEISENIEKSINELQLIYEKISKSKEEMKLNLQKIFTTIRSKINEREDELLKEIDKKYDDMYFKEDIVVDSKKLPKKINESIEQGNLINNGWNENKYELNFLINGCLNIENNLKEIDIMNESLKKYNNNNTEFKYNPEGELNYLLDKIKSFGNLNFDIKLPTITDKFNISQNPLVITPNDTYTQQKVTMDPCPNGGNKNKIYHIIGFSNWNKIRIYNNFDSFKNQIYDEMILPINGYGSNWTIFKNCLYFTKDSGSKIVKINLKTNKKENEISINDNSGDTGQWVGYNYIIFISNPNSVYIIYQSKNNNKLVIRELNPDTLEIINNWETNAKQKSSYGALFMIGKILFCIERYDSSPTKIIYKYDLEKKIDYNVSINFQNIGGYDTSLHYCYNTKQLWTVNGGKFYSYDIEL